MSKKSIEISNVEVGQPISFCIVQLACRVFFFRETPPPMLTLSHMFVPDRDYIITMIGKFLLSSPTWRPNYSMLPSGVPEMWIHWIEGSRA